MREDTTIERPAKKISMIDGYAESESAAPDDVIITPPPAEDKPADETPAEDAEKKDEE